MSGQVERDDESCEEVVSVLDMKMSAGKRRIAGDNEQREMVDTLRKGLPRFVVFIIWLEVAWRLGSGCEGGTGGADLLGMTKRLVEDEEEDEEKEGD